MKIKLGNILEINNVLKQIIDNTELKIDALFKFKLLGIMKSFEIPVTNFEVIRNDKIREYGKELEDENGNSIFGIDEKDEESMNKFRDDISKIIDSDVEVSIKKLKPSDVFNKGLPADYLVGLYNIIEE